MSRKVTKKMDSNSIEKICELLEKGYKPSEVAKKLSVSIYNVKNIKYEKAHKEISNKYNISKRYKSRPINEETVHEICEMIKKGISLKEISELMGVHSTTVSQISCGRIYGEIVKMHKLDQCDKLNKSTVHKVCKMMEDGASTQKISIELCLPMRIISMIRNGFIYDDIRSSYNIQSRIVDEDTVHDICEMLKDGYTHSEISKLTNVSVSTISNIRCGKSYKRIRSKHSISSYRKSDDVIHNICRMIKDGYRNKDICDQLKVEKNVIDSIRYNNAYHHIAILYGIENKKYSLNSTTNNKYKNVIIMLENGCSIKEIQEKTKVSERTIYRIRKEIKLYNSVEDV